MKSPQYEQALTKEGVTFHYLPRLALEAIDVKKGLGNQARLLYPVDQELVNRYIAMDNDGLEAPAIVVYQMRNRKRWVVIDGNQRVQAALANKKKTLDAYVVETEDQMIIDRLTWRFNNLVNGKPLSREECLQHAVSFVQRYGMSHEQAAKEWGVNKWDVKKAMNALEMRDILRRRNVTAPPNLTDEKLDELKPLAKYGEDVFVEAAVTVGKCGLTVDDIQQLRKDVNAAATFEDKVKVVHDLALSERARVRKAETKGGTVKALVSLPRDRLVRELKNMSRLLEEYDDPKVFRPIGSKAFEEARVLATEVVAKLDKVFLLGSATAKQEHAPKSDAKVGDTKPQPNGKGTHAKVGATKGV